MFPPPTPRYLTLDHADDELARRAVESGARVEDPFDAMLGRSTIGRTMEQWMQADEVDLIDGPVVLGFDLGDAEW